MQEAGAQCAGAIVDAEEGSGGSRAAGATGGDRGGSGGGRAKVQTTGQWSLPRIRAAGWHRERVMGGLTRPSQTVSIGKTNYKCEENRRIRMDGRMRKQ